MKAKLGHLVEVKNESRRFGSNTKYCAVHVIHNGEEVPLLMTYGEISQMKARADINQEDIPEIKRPWWQLIFG